jgi:hypothetical protein
MRACIRLVLLAFTILAMTALSASAYDFSGSGAAIKQGGKRFILAADQAPTAQPHSPDAARRTKSLQHGLEQLGLSKKQMEEIGRITQEFRKAVEPLGPSAQALAKERNNLVNQGAAKDKPRIAEIDQEMAKMRKQVVEARSRLQSRLMAIMSPEQRQRFEQIIRSGGQGGSPAAR